MFIATCLSAKTDIISLSSISNPLRAHKEEPRRVLFICEWA